MISPSPLTSKRSNHDGQKRRTTSLNCLLRAEPESLCPIEFRERLPISEGSQGHVGRPSSIQHSRRTKNLDFFRSSCRENSLEPPLPVESRFQLASRPATSREPYLT